MVTNNPNLQYFIYKNKINYQMSRCLMHAQFHDQLQGQVFRIELLDQNQALKMFEKWNSISFFIPE